MLQGVLVQTAVFRGILVATYQRNEIEIIYSKKHNLYKKLQFEVRHPAIVARVYYYSNKIRSLKSHALEC